MDLVSQVCNELAKQLTEAVLDDMNNSIRGDKEMQKNRAWSYMDNYEEEIHTLAEDVVESADFHENSAHATNRVTGSISLDSPNYSLLTIPYTDGWTATVDGKEQELLQANTM